MKSIRIAFVPLGKRDDDEIDSILAELRSGDLSVKDYRLVDRERLLFEVDLEARSQIVPHLLD